MKKILLIGDDCIDVYQYGRVESISPEAPVPIFIPTDTIMKPGMVSNVENNFRSLGCDVFSFKGKQVKPEFVVNKILSLKESITHKNFIHINIMILKINIFLVDFNEIFCGCSLFSLCQYMLFGCDANDASNGMLFVIL